MDIILQTAEKFNRNEKIRQKFIKNFTKMLLICREI